jgi:coenzyme PQQ precursor peptide PqqA
MLLPYNITEAAMTWKAPKLAEIALGGEINCYACARVK